MSTYIDKIQKYIAINEIEKAIDDLISTIDLFKTIDPNSANDSIDLRNQISMISANFHDLKKNRELGLLDDKEIRLYQNKINYSILQLILNFVNYPDFYQFLTKYERTGNINLTTDEIKIINSIWDNFSNEDKYVYDIFLSFSSKDLDDTKLIYNKFRNANLSVFLSSENLQNSAGHFFSDKIEYALKHSKNFVLHCTQNSMSSYWVKLEYSAFFNKYHCFNPNERFFIILKGNTFVFDLVPTLLVSLQFADNAEQVIYSLKYEELNKIQEERIAKEKADLKHKQEQIAKKQANLKRKQEQKRIAKEQADLNSKVF